MKLSIKSFALMVSLIVLFVPVSVQAEEDDGLYGVLVGESKTCPPDKANKKEGYTHHWIANDVAKVLKMYSGKSKLIIVFDNYDDFKEAIEAVGTVYDTEKRPLKKLYGYELNVIPFKKKLVKQWIKVPEDIKRTVWYGEQAKPVRWIEKDKP
jgi:hypothetical protein